MSEKVFKSATEVLLETDRFTRNCYRFMNEELGLDPELGLPEWAGFDEEFPHRGNDETEPIPFWVDED